MSLKTGYFPIYQTSLFFLINIFAILSLVTASITLTQLLDGFSVMIILLIPIFVGNFILANIAQYPIIQQIFNIIFPVNKLILLSSNIFIAKQINWLYYFSLIGWNIILFVMGKYLFLRKWK